MTYQHAANCHILEGKTRKCSSLLHETNHDDSCLIIKQAAEQCFAERLLINEVTNAAQASEAQVAFKHNNKDSRKYNLFLLQLNDEKAVSVIKTISHLNSYSNLFGLSLSSLLSVLCSDF